MRKTDEHIQSAKRRAIYNRNYRRARERALVRLSKDNPDLYLQYLNEERMRDEEQGKTWVDLDLDSGLPVRLSSQDKRGSLPEGLSYSQGEGDDGGEA